MGILDITIGQILAWILGFLSLIAIWVGAKGEFGSQVKYATWAGLALFVGPFLFRGGPAFLFPLSLMLLAVPVAAALWRIIEDRLAVKRARNRSE